ncbi:hypothetical protein [Bradyrhizobium embrapense]|uniref:hypothetical protein n=1 Tax=Bradyrhizobium embrapense TaxID=630921 RepID=UPI00067E0108
MVVYINSFIEHELTKIFSYIEEKRDEFVQRLINYLKHPSISAQDVGVQEVPTLLIRMMRDMGLEASARPTKAAR